jgi:dolichol-phosphate mannosyltransferase
VSVFGVRKFLRRHLTPEQRRVIKFLVVGTSGVPVNLGTVYLATVLIPVGAFDGVRDILAQALGIATLTSAGLRDVLAYGLGIVVSILTNFLLNNYWTWGDRVAGDDRSQFLRRLVKFYLVSSVAAAVQLGTSAVVSALVRGNPFFAYSLHADYRVYHAFAPMVGILCGLAINFVANNLWTFRHKQGA